MVRRTKEKLSAKFEDFLAYVNGPLWRLDIREAGSRKRFLLYQLRVALIVFRRVREGELPLWAASLTFFSLLSIVPLLAVAFSLFKALGGMSGLQNKIEPLILENIVVGSQEAVRDQIHSFITHINAGAIGVVSAIILAVAIITTMTRIEKSFNTIWGIEKHRNFFGRLSVYTTIIVFAPILLGASISFTSALQSHHFTAYIQNNIPHSEAVLRMFFRLSPIFLTCITFTTMYAIMPNTRVHIPSALTGGVFAGLVWETAKIIYTAYQAKSTQYNAIYGSLAAIPFFLIWIYISWLIVLLGAQVTYANENAGVYDWDQSDKMLTYRVKQMLGIWLMLRIARAFQGGKRPFSITDLEGCAPAPVRWINHVLTELSDGGLILETMNDAEDRAYTLIRPMDKIDVANIYDVLASGGQPPSPFRHDYDADFSMFVLASVHQAIEKSSQNISLKQALDRIDLEHPNSETEKLGAAISQ